MKKLPFIILYFILFSSNAQTTLFEENFESYDDFVISNIGNWTMHDLDLAPTWNTPETSWTNANYIGAGIIFNPSTCTNDVSSAGNYSIRETGSKYLSFWCAQEVTNNNYLMSPMIDLASTSNVTLSFWVKSLADAISGFDPEQFEVLLSTTGNAIDDFTINLGGVYSISDCCEWNEYSFDLTSYNGNQIYFAIHHITSQNGFALHFDDFKVIDNNTSEINDYIGNIVPTTFPNPFNHSISINSEETIDQIIIFNSFGQKVIDKNLSSKKTTINTSFLTTGIYIAKIRSGLGIKTIKIVKK
jgi:hypothetical protein